MKRAVPTVVNARFTGPFQFDGRLLTLESQAVAAMEAHSEITSPPSATRLNRIVNFQRNLFSSQRVKNYALAIESGAPLPNPDPPLNPLETQGKATFQQFCVSCHGGPSQTVNHDARFLPAFARGPTASGPQAFVNVFVQTPRPPPPAAPPPAPPTPAFFAGLPTAGLASTSYAVSTPAGTQTVVTSDAGRMLVTGDAREQGRFDQPTLFGVGRTAPYFHDNSSPALVDVIDHYNALFEFMRFVDVEGGLFAPLANGQGCDKGTCGFEPIPADKIDGLKKYLQKTGT